MTPKRWNTSAVSRIDSGIAVSVIRLVRKFHRNTNRTTNTQTVPSRIASTTLSIGASMKSAWRKMFALDLHVPGGSVALDLVQHPVDPRRQSPSVLAPGCFWTVRITAGPPADPPSSSDADAAVAARGPGRRSARRPRP